MGGWTRFALAIVVLLTIFSAFVACWEFDTQRNGESIVFQKNMEGEVQSHRLVPGAVSTDSEVFGARYWLKGCRVMESDTQIIVIMGSDQKHKRDEFVEYFSGKQ